MWLFKEQFTALKRFLHELRIVIKDLVKRFTRIYIRKRNLRKKRLTNFREKLQIAKIKKNGMRFPILVL